jgi:hypothetical protein
VTGEDAQKEKARQIGGQMDFAFVCCLLFEQTSGVRGWPWAMIDLLCSTKVFIRRPVIATLALDGAPVCHDPDNRARASDLDELWHVS